jgi:LCP family protein required for cell wall assembly
MAVTMIVAWVMLALIGILPAKYFWPIIILDALLGTGAAVLLLTTNRVGHKARYAVSMGLTVVMILANLAVVKVASDYTTVIEEMAPTGESVQYDLIGLKEGPDDLAAFIGAQVPADATDPLYGQASQKAAEMVALVIVPVSGQAAVVDSVVKGETKGGLVQDTYLQILEEAAPDTYDKVKIIASFSVDVTAPTKSPDPTATPSHGSLAGPDTPFVVYISGIDVAGPIASRARSDVNILVVVNPKTGKILLVNTPRDFFVQLHDRPGLKDKLTHAGVYGIDVSTRTLEDLFDVDINYYLRANFTSLVTIVNALGGVDVYSEYSFTSRHGGYYFQQGMNHMNGDQALGFSRERYSFASGDRQRGKNQEAVIEAIVDKISSPALLARYQQLLNSINGAFQTSMPQDEISAQVKLMLAKNTKWDITSISVDGTGAMLPTYTYPGQNLYVMIPDQATVDAAKAAIDEVLAAT